MLKSLIALGALLGTVTSVAHVGFGDGGVRVGGTTVAETVLQVREVEGGHVLASRDAVESLGGVVEVAVDGGVVAIEPGIRLTRTSSGYELSTHARRPMVFTTPNGSLAVQSPASITASENGWTTGTGEALEGHTLRVALTQPVDGTRVALADAPPAGTSTPPAAGTPHMTIRRVVYIDPRPGAEPTDAHNVKRSGDVSPSGL